MTKTVMDFPSCTFNLTNPQSHHPPSHKSKTVTCKNQFGNSRQKIKLIQLDFSNSIYKISIADQLGDSVDLIYLSSNMIKGGGTKTE